MVDTMRAVILKSHGPAEGLVLGTSPLPEVGPEQVLIKVRAASVNRPDIMQREGNYPPPPGESDILGLEVAGTVATVGKEVTNWRVGDRVMALIGGGGYAEYALAHAGHVMRIPDILDFHQAACICETYITAYLNLFMLGGFNEGQFALVHGGGGGSNDCGDSIVSGVNRQAEAHRDRIYRESRASTSARRLACR